MPDPAESEADPDRLQAWRLPFGLVEALEKSRPALPCAETVETHEKTPAF